MKIIPFLFIFLLVAGCASTSSVLLNHQASANPTVAILPLDGQLGAQASDLIAEELAREGIPTIDRTRLLFILQEQGFRGDMRFDQSSVAQYGKTLGVKKVFSGTVTTSRGPLSSFPHVFITLKVIDVETSQVTWIGRYGDPGGTWAFSTQGDLKRGAKKIVEEFIKVHGKDF